MANNKSISEIYERDSRRANPFKRISFKPDFDGDAFSSTVSSATAVLEALCFEGAGGWSGRTTRVPERPRVSSRLLEGATMAPVIWGSDRATSSLYDPLENLWYMLDKFLSGVQDWATKAKCFQQVTRPLIIRTMENSINEASTAKIIREALKKVGPIDVSYVNSFEEFSPSMGEPILELRALGDFIASVLREDGEITPTGTGHSSPPSNSTLQNSSSHFAKILNPVAEASGSRSSVETKSASTPTSSPFFSTILNPEPDTQASTSGHVEAENTAVQRTAYEDLVEAAAYDTDSNKKSPSPEHEPERASKSDLQYPGSPSYSPPTSPSSLVNRLLKPLSATWITAGEPSRDISSSSLLQRPSSLSQIKPSPAPPGTPQWKIDLSSRKGHRIDILHVGPRELDIFEKCLALVHSATRKGEECARVVVEMQRLAAEMQQEYKQWDEIRELLEEFVRWEEQQAREKLKLESGDIDGDDEKSKSGKGKGKDPAIYGPTAYGADAYGGNDEDWFGTANPRDYGRIGPRDDDDAWGYRKVDLPPSYKAKAVRRRASSFADDDDDETEDETEEDRGAQRDFGMGSESSTVRMGSPMSMSVSQTSSGTEGVEVVTNFEEAFGGEDDEGEDQEMLDAGDGEEVADEGAAGKTGLKSGGKVLGLYGEEL